MDSHIAGNIPHLGVFTQHRPTGDIHLILSRRAAAFALQAFLHRAAFCTNVAYELSEFWLKC
jgi:hypothetical protein